MKLPMNSWIRALFLVGAAAVFVALALAEAFPAPQRPHSSARFDTWDMHLVRVDAALAQHDVKGAIAAWQAARAAARDSHRWEGLLAVGDAYLRIGDAIEFRRAFVPSARESYAEALAVARGASSLDGVLRVATAFGAIGDETGVTTTARIGAELIAR